MEQRLQQLESLVGELREEQAALRENVKALHDLVAELRESVGALTAAMNKATGAVWAFSIISAGVGGLVGFAVSVLHQ